MRKVLSSACHHVLEEVAEEPPYRHTGQLFLEDFSN